MLAEFPDSFGMKCGSPRSKLASRILAKIIERHVPEIHFRKRHWPAIRRWFRFRIDFVHKDTHPLIPIPMRIHRSALLSSGLDFYSFLSRLHGVVRINTLDDEVRMTVEIGILDENPSVIGKA